MNELPHSKPALSGVEGRCSKGWEHNDFWRCLSTVEQQLRIMNGKIAALLAILIASASAAAKDKPGLNPTPVGSDRMAVYRAFLISYSKDVKHLKLARRSVPFELLKDDCLKGIWFSNRVTWSTVHEFNTRNLPSNISLVDSEEQERIFRSVDDKQTWRDGKPVNESVEKAQAAGFLVLSEIAFDRKHEYAVLTYSFECWGLCGGGGTVVFRKRNGAWTPTNRSCAIWAS